ncbi:hypothetical protein [Methylobacterium sp. CM6247]
MSLRLQPVQVRTGSNDTASQLVFADGFLVAVLVQLCEHHEEDAGRWFLEAGFGPVDHQCPPTFGSLDEAQDWIEQRLAHVDRRNTANGAP